MEAMKKTDRPSSRLKSRGATYVFQTDNKPTVSKIQVKYFSRYIKKSAKLRNTAESLREDKCVRKDSAVTDLCMMKL